MAVDRVGVHATHCCNKCGCKYGDSDCPVELGLVEAEYECECCQSEKEDLRRAFSEMSISELQETISHLKILVEKLT